MGGYPSWCESFLDEAVLRWATILAPDEVTVTVVTVEEIERGLARLPLGSRRSDLESCWHALLGAYADGVLPSDLSAVRETSGSPRLGLTSAARFRSRMRKSPAFQSQVRRCLSHATPRTSTRSWVLERS